MNLKDAFRKNRLDQFIKEHKGLKGDPEAFEQTLRSMASGKSPEARPASSQGDTDD